MVKSNILLVAKEDIFVSDSATKCLNISGEIQKKNA